MICEQWNHLQRCSGGSTRRLMCLLHAASLRKNLELKSFFVCGPDHLLASLSTPRYLCGPFATWKITFFITSCLDDFELVVYLTLKLLQNFYDQGVSHHPVWTPFLEANPNFYHTLTDVRYQRRWVNHSGLTDPQQDRGSISIKRTRCKPLVFPTSEHRSVCALAGCPRLFFLPFYFQNSVSG